MENAVLQKWDSENFGFNVARITAGNINDSDFRSVLEGLKTSNHRMAYWSFPQDRRDLYSIAIDNGGFLADEKVTYIKELASAVNQNMSVARTVSYDRGDLEPGLVALALQSGEYSRFRVDPQFPAELFEKLYTAWIVNSVTREIAWDVLVMRNDAGINGLITLGTKNGRGDIGLVAVAEHVRGMGIGRQLVRDAERCFAQRGINVAQVVTQGCNAGGCRLYESCGFHVEKTEYVFHFWL